jgi:hypothetical protein
MLDTIEQPDVGVSSSQISPRSRRRVVVNDPRLSEASNRLLSEQARAVVGTDWVNVPVSRSHPSQGGLSLSAGPILNVTNNRVLIRSMLTSAMVIGAIVALTGGSWWLLPLAVIVLCVATASIVGMVLGMLKATEHPSPECAAALQADGVRDPDRLLSAIVNEFIADESDRRSRG